MGKYDEIAEAKKEIMGLKDKLLKKDRRIEDLERLVRMYEDREDRAESPNVIVVYKYVNNNP